MLRVLAALCLATLCAAAQESTVFQGGTRMVPVDVVVRDKHGFVYGLTQDQFTLEDNGKPQAISIFTAPAAPVPGAPAPPPLPPGTVSNRVTSSGEQPAGATVILFDRLNTPIGDQPFVLSQLRQLVHSRAGKDRMAIYILDRSIQVLQDLTGDQQALEKAVDQLKPKEIYVPRGDSIAGLLIWLRIHVDTLTGAMEDIARHLVQVPGRKNLIWISSSFALRINTPMLNIDFTPQISAALRKVTDAHVAVYPLDARGLQAAGGVPVTAGPGAARGAASRAPLREPPNLATLNFFADQTGGEAFYNTNGIAQSIERVTEDAGQTYTLGFSPAESTLDGKFHKLRVRVNAPGVELLSRPGYLAATAGSDTAPRPSFETLLSNNLDQAEIGVMAHIEPAANGQVRIDVSADAHNLAMPVVDGRHTGSVDILVSDGSAASVSRTTQLTDAEFTEALAKPFGVIWQVTVTPRAGAKEIRLIVQDRATGAAGSVRLPVPTR